MKIRAFVIFVVLLGILPDIAVTCWLLPGMAWPWKCLLCLPTLAVLILLPMIAFGIRYSDAVRATSHITFLLQLPKTLFALLYAAFRGAQGGLYHALVPALAVAAIFAILFFLVAKHLTVNARELHLEGLPKAFDGLRICLLADLHLGSFGRDHLYVRRVVDRVRSLSPDLICYAGDLVNFSSSDADPYLEDLSALQAPLGVYSVRGNHDYMHHSPFKGEAREADARRLLEMERNLGWTPLLDAHMLLVRGDARIALAGVENTSANPLFGDGGGDLKRALEGIPEGTFTILMTHDPAHWRSEVIPHGDIHLTLSGHTHGLKYKLAGPRPKYWKLPESSGLYVEGEQALYVSPGLGSSFAFRLSGFPCIDILTLKPL